MKQPILRTIRPLIVLGFILSFSVALVGARILHTGHTLFLFLVWNLFLAFVPFSISYIMYRTERLQKRSLLQGVLIGIWLLFLPNAPYMITDLFHLRVWLSRIVWFDTLLIFSFALSGLILFYWSLKEMETVIFKTFSMVWGIVFSTIVIFMSAFGIYVGRYMRFNSWDIVSDPTALATELLDLVIYPMENTRAWGMTLGYGVLLLLGYIGISFFISETKRSLQQVSNV